MVVAAPQKGFPTGSVMGSLLTPSHYGGGCVSPALGTPVGWGASVGEPSLGPRAGQWGAGECW